MKKQILIIGTFFLIYFPLLATPVKLLSLTEDTVATVPISFRGAILSFPSKPEKVIVGNQGSFAVEYVKNDVIISPLTSRARSNVFVYLNGRRFNIDTYAKPNGYTLVLVRDKTGQNIEVEYEKQ